MLSNYIPDENRFHLAGPPEWWMRKLWDFDSSLVVIPSRQQYVYRLAQRRKLRLPEGIVNDALFQENDSRMMASYGLIPVTTILPTANWSNPYLFVELSNRAPHRLGGAAKAIAALEAQEDADDARRQAQTDDHLKYLSKDAWGLYNKKVGLRSHMFIPRTK